VPPKRQEQEGRGNPDSGRKEEKRKTEELGPVAKRMEDFPDMKLGHSGGVGKRVDAKALVNVQQSAAGATAHKRAGEETPRDAKNRRKPGGAGHPNGACQGAGWEFKPKRPGGKKKRGRTRRSEPAGGRSQPRADRWESRPGQEGQAVPNPIRQGKNHDGGGPSGQR